MADLTGRSFVGEGAGVEAYNPESRRGHFKDGPIQQRASDSFEFTRWDQYSLRGGIQTHPGIDENGVFVMAVPSTNLLSLLTLTGTGLRIRG